MDMWRFLVHVQHCQNYIVCPVGLSEPVDVIPAPFVQPARLLYLLHVCMCASQHNTDGLYLILSCFPFNLSQFITDITGTV